MFKKVYFGISILLFHKKFCKTLFLKRKWVNIPKNSCYTLNEGIERMSNQTENNQHHDSDSARSISNIIKQMMNECHIIEAELARQTGLPQTTINRLLLGDTFDPRANTLIPIAKFFGITIGQLLGQEPINHFSRIPGTVNLTNKSAWIIIPIIEWHEVKSWIFEKNRITPSSYPRWITTEKNVSSHSFGLQTSDFMEPRFRKGSTVIVDPNYEYQDGNFVIISLANAEPTARRILKDGADVYLRRLYGTDEPIKKQNADVIIGTIIETRINEN